MPRFAAIDVGSNALRLRIIEASGAGRTVGDHSQLALLPGERESAWREVVTLRAPVRLGTGVFLSGKLAPTAIGQACAALKEFRREMDTAKVDAYRATATSAVREASNGSTLIERARREAGIELEAIEGVEEARLIQLAVTRRLPVEDKRALLIDVGGGSTELTVLDHGTSTYSISLPVGTVRLIEAFLKESPTVSAEGARLIRETIDRALAEARPHLSKLSLDVLIGTGGNIDTMAELCAAKVEGRAVDVPSLKVLFTKLCALSPVERQKAFSLRADRADTIVPAAAIFLRLAEVFGAATIVAPGVGLKEGVLEELVDRHFKVWDVAGEVEGVLFACTRVGRRYQFDEAHGQLVSRLAAQLFDDMKDVHGFGDRERLLLRAAALLHDVGDFVRYDGHHKHTYYLIQHADIMGLTPEEREIVANIARYHRKSAPDTSHPNFHNLTKDARGKVRALAAILRIADALDREHLGKVKQVSASIDKAKGRLTLTLTGDEERLLEEWTVRAKAGLLRDVFGLEVTLTEDSPREAAKT